MHPIKPLFLSLLPLTLLGSSFEEASEHLDLDGTFVAYMDFDGDGQELGEKLNRLYQEVLAVNPNMPPIPLDFPALFDALGFGSLKAIGASSIEIEDGLHLNRSVALLEDELSGIFRMYEVDTTEFTAAALAPADATTVVSGHMDFMPLIDTVTNIADQVMGPMGVSFVDNWLASPAFGTEVSFGDFIATISGKWDIALRQGLTIEMENDLVVWIAIDGAGSLLPNLHSLESTFGVSFTENDDGLTADFSNLIPDNEMGLYLFAPAGSDDLIVYTDPNWTAESEGPRLSETSAYQALAGRLPEEAMAFNYSAGFDVTPIYQFIESNPQSADYIGIARRVVDELLSDFLEPTVGASYMQDDALLTEQYAGYSTKQIVAIMPAAVAGGLTAAMAVPAMQNVQATSVEKAATNNLRQIASAAQQYMLDTGEDRASMSDIIGPDKYISQPITPVAGESYDDIVITYETYSISVVLADGRVVSYKF